MRSPLLLTAAAALALALQGCAHAPPPGGASGAGPVRLDAAARCELVRTLVQDPVPARLLQSLKPTSGQAPVLVFVRTDGLLERFFSEDAQCQGTDFRVQRQSDAEALVLYLEPTSQGGYSYEARRTSPDALVLDGPPTGRVSRGEKGWVTSDEGP
jgi:hypothetical protein